MSNDEGHKTQKEIISTEIELRKVDLELSPVPIGDILDEIMPQGEETTCEEWVNTPIVIHTVRFFVGEFGPAAFVVFTDENGVLYHFVLGQTVVLPKLAAVRDRLPVSATLKMHEGGQHGEYYDIE